jgi:pimeloyl-ACP methyl ester carboxylesterase
MVKKPESHYIHVHNMRLHYLDREGMSSESIVLLHGIGDNAHIWDHVVSRLPEGIRVVALDQRGHGRSTWAVPPAYSCDDYVSDLDAVVNTLHLEDIVLMGHSMGALHATRYASLRPDKVKGLIHADIEPCPPEWNKKYLYKLYHDLPTCYNSIEEYVEWMRTNSPHAEQGLLHNIASFSIDQEEDGTFKSQYDREVLYHFDRYDLWPCLGDIVCPTLVIRGRESRVMSRQAAEAMSHAIPECRFVEIPEAAHPVHTDNPAGFQRAVYEFLREATEIVP